MVGAAAAGACASGGGRPGSPPDPVCRTDGEHGVRWILAGGDQQTELDRWCAGVGAPVVRRAGLAPPAGGTDTTPRARRLLVVSWNVAGGSADIGALLRDLQAGRWGPADYRVLLLQEASRSDGSVPDSAPPGSRWGRPLDAGGDRADIVEVARRYGMSLLYVPSMRNARIAEDRGNAILSELPLRDPVAVELPFERDRRVAVSAEVVADGIPLRLTATHLDHLSNPFKLPQGFGAGRARQMRALLAALPPHPAGLLSGDFNVWVGEEAEPAVRMAQEAYPSGRRGPPDPTARGPTGLLARRLDYLFARLPDGWRFSYRVAPDRYGSDHHPLIGEVEWATLP